MATAGLIQAARAAGAVSHAGGRSRDSARLWAAVLAELPLFEHVSARHVRKIAGQGSIARFEPGSTIIRSGQTGDAFYVVLDGKGSVIRRRGLTSVRVRAGGYFGEMALFASAPRSATIVADTEMTCLRIGRAAFLKIVRDEPSVSLALLRTLAERVRVLQSAATD